VSEASQSQDLDPKRYRHVVSRFATGVTVVSTVVDGVRYGLTVNSFTSVSLDPLLVLFCCEIDCEFHEPVLTAGRWGVSVLSETQAEDATWFATRGVPGVDQFTGRPGVRSGRMLAVPLLTDALATFECRTWTTYEGGDHTVVIGEVVEATITNDGDPLLYFGSAYRGVAPSDLT
jgi:flavin reductase (DIM6/NTAB) family NADH-FMN oxidoreductase RutF